MSCTPIKEHPAVDGGMERLIGSIDCRLETALTADAA